MNNKVMVKFPEDIEQHLLGSSHLIHLGNKSIIIPQPLMRFDEDEPNTYRIDVEAMPLQLLSAFNWKYKTTMHSYNYPIYERGNYFLMVVNYPKSDNPEDGEYYSFVITLKDPSLFKRIPDPEVFRIIVKHPTISQFMALEQMIFDEDSIF